MEDSNECPPGPTTTEEEGVLPFEFFGRDPPFFIRRGAEDDEDDDVNRCDEEDGEEREMSSSMSPAEGDVTGRR